MQKINILITHVSYQAAAGSFIKMLRNSKQYQYYIVGCDSIKKGYSSGSMLVDKFFYVPFEPLSQEYVNSITKICKTECITLMISAEEDDLITFKLNKIPQSFFQYIPDFSIFNLFRDKYTATINLQQKGIIVPKTIKDLSELNKSRNDQFIYRKRVSCSSRGIKIFYREELRDTYDFFTEEYIIQEFIKGDLYTVDVLCDKYGGMHMAIPRRELSLKDGTTFKCVIDKNDLIIDLCKKVYSEYCIPGLSNIQFILENDTPYFIELNPRAAATMIASSLSSVNYLDLYFKHIMFDADLPNYEFLMDTVKWGSVISRYYQETILLGGEY